MVEIARAFTVTDDAAAPRRSSTSPPRRSTPRTARPAARNSCAAVVAGGRGVILISHLLGEILHYSDRVVVMTDGEVVADRPAAASTATRLVGGHGQRWSRITRRGRDQRRHASAARRRSWCARQSALQTDGAGTASPIAARSSASPGLAGHGQTDAAAADLRRRGRPRMHGVEVQGAGGASSPATARPTASFRYGRSPRTSASARCRAAAAACWSTPRREAETGRDPGSNGSGIRTPDMRQQHPVAVRRQPAEGGVRPRARLRCRDRADGRPDARRRYRHQARGLRPDARRGGQAGRTFLWYTTEMDELEHCDHVYVFRNGRIVADLPRERD